MIRFIFYGNLTLLRSPGPHLCKSKQKMNIRYIYSACLEIQTSDVCILTDPWFSQGIYDGSWFHFPNIESPLDILTEPDVIYVSHIHPDHYDPEFLRCLFKKWGPKPILIPSFEENHLLKKCDADGIEATPIKTVHFGKTSITIIPNITGSRSDIDSSIYVDDNRHRFLNINDCRWNDSFVRELQSRTNAQREALDLIALGYTGAGTFPQTYFDIATEREQLLAAAERKKSQFFRQYQRYCSSLPARHHLPFAGNYILGGKLAKLNHYRGVADAVEVTDFDDKAIVLDDFGKGAIDLLSDSVQNRRVNKYKIADLDAEIDRVADRMMDYERDVKTPISQMSFHSLLQKSYETAIRHSEVDTDYHFLIEVDNNHGTGETFILNSNPRNPLLTHWKKTERAPEPYEHLRVDYRHLFGLLNRTYHWDNAEIGSHLVSRRRPKNSYNKQAGYFLNFLYTGRN